MFSRRSFDQQNEDSTRVNCFSFSKKRSKSSSSEHDRSTLRLPSDLFSAPSSSSLSIASCSLSCIPAVPEVTPLHLDIPYVAASPASHSNTLASIERFDTPRASNYGPVSEAGRAVVAARKHSMRQEHLAAIANLNTFAKKRSSKSPNTTSGSEASSPTVSKVSMPSAISDGHTQRPRHLESHVLSPAGPSGRAHMHPEATWSEESLLPCGPAAVSAGNGPNMSSGSMYEAGDWHQGGFNVSRQPQQQAAAATPTAKMLATLEHSGAAQQHAAAASPSREDQPWLQATSFSSTPPLADGTDTKPLEHSQHQPAGSCPGTRPAAGASIASRHSNYSSSSSSYQDGSTTLHTASTSSSSSYTKASSLVSKACSSPRQHGVSASQTQQHGRYSANQQAVTVGTANGTHFQSVSQQQAAATSSTAFASHQDGNLPMEKSNVEAPPKAQGPPAQLREHELHSTLASRESSPDESLIAEGWIVAGTIMSNRDYKPDDPEARAAANVDATSAPSALPQKEPASQPLSTPSALSEDEVAQLTRELEVLKEQPRAQMTSQQLGRYLDVKIKLGRAGSLSSTSSGRVQQPRLQEPSVGTAETTTPTRPSPPVTSAEKQNNARVKPSAMKAAVAPSKVVQEAKPSARPAPRPKRVVEHSHRENASSGRHVPAYMKPTASVKAKDARDQQAKIAASRTALAEKKWNRA